MASNIDPTKPTEGTATTQSVRDNFAAAKEEIEALQLLAGTAVQPEGLSAVASSGSYSDLSDKPALGSAAATDATDYATTAQGAAADAAIPETQKAAALGVATLDADIRLPEAQLPTSVPRISTVGGVTSLVGPEAKVTISQRDRSILLIGDSTLADSTYRQVGTHGNILLQRSFGMFGFANKLLKQRFTRIINNAVGGSQATQWASNSAADRNLTTQIADVAAAYCMIAIGTNDIGTAGRAAAQVLADIYTIWLAAVNSGKHTAVCTIAPRRTGGASNFTAAQQKTLALVNAGLMKYAATVPGFNLIDIAPSLTDYTVGAYESPASSGRVLYDDIHFNNRAAYLVGKKIKTFYENIVPEFDAGCSAYLDDSTNDANNKNLLNCGMMQGTLGAGRPTGWNAPSNAGGLTAATTETVVVAPDGVGQGYQLDIDATAATGTGGFVRTYAIWDNTTAPLVAGDTVFAEIYFKIEGLNGSGTPVNINTPRIQLQVAAGAAPSYTSDGEEGSSTGTMAALPSENFEGVLRTAPYVYQGTEGASLNTTLWLNMYFFGVGSCRITFWRGRVMKNDDYYTPFGTIDHTFPWQ